MLTPWKSDRILVDPFCGSGTFPIEAAMIAANMAPGMNREFLSEDWKHLIPRKCWYDAMDEANDLVDLSVQTDIQGYDIDGDIIRAARANAEGSRRGRTDPFPAASGEWAQPSEKIRIPDHKPAVWGANRGEEEPAGVI